MMIVDSHTHIGNEQLCNIVMDSKDLLAVMEEYHVDKAIVQPQGGAPDIMENTREVADLVAAHPGMLYGLASFNPALMDYDTFMERAKWAIEDLGFKGIKLHTNCFGISPLNPLARRIFEVGRIYHVPVLIHTGAGGANALPCMAIPMAKEFSDVPVVLSHAGGGSYGSEAIITAQECENVYLETSWCSILDVQAMASSIGASRMMFGADVYQNVGPSLALYERSGLSDSELEQILGKTACELFKLD